MAIQRPTLLDVDRLSRGLAATRRGVGSRRVPHRLNAEERTAYEVAERKGFAVLRDGGSWRRDRKGSPLLNILRQRADAIARPLVWVELEERRRRRRDDEAAGDAAAASAHVLVDLAPLRLRAELCDAAAALQALRTLE